MRADPERLLGGPPAGLEQAGRVDGACLHHDGAVAPAGLALHGCAPGDGGAGAAARRVQAALPPHPEEAAAGGAAVAHLKTAERTGRAVETAVRHRHAAVRVDQQPLAAARRCHTRKRRCAPDTA